MGAIVAGLLVAVFSAGGDGGRKAPEHPEPAFADTRPKKLSALALDRLDVVHPARPGTRRVEEIRHQSVLSSGGPSTPAVDTPHRFSAMKQPDSERFRANPRTCGRFQGILSLR
jgi:hypothetical protein